MSSPNLSQYKAYAQATQTVAKTRQVVMLYDAAIRDMKQAREAILDKRYEERFHLLTRVSEILTGLQSALDFAQGGRIAEMLDEFYRSLDMRVRQLHRTNSAETCDAIVAELKEMRDGWDSVDRQQAASKAPAPMEIDPIAAGLGEAKEHALTFSAITA